MTSYFDYYNRENCDKIKGTCYSMCPEEEIKLRISSKLVHVLEVVGSERKLVKSYCRSAADMHMAVPHLLRPYAVLKSTVEYLLLTITKRDDIPQSAVYHFVDNRLRAVRQDMTIQRLPADECIKLLEPMVRFYVYYGYLLSNLPLKDYDPVMNQKYLLECTKWCLKCSDSVVISPDKELTDRFAKFFNMNDKERSLECDMVLVESIYILCNLDNIQPLYRYVKLSEDLKKDPKLQLAYRLAIANMQGNFIRVCRLVNQLCPLTYCAVLSYLPTLQRRALHILSHGFHNKRLTVPSDVIARWLHFSDQQQVHTTCRQYGLMVEGHSVLFDKTGFKADAKMHQPRTHDVKTKFNMANILDIYSYSGNSYKQS